MSDAAPATPVSSRPAVACTNCRRPMQALRLAGHYGATVDVDLCEPCHLLWFDSLEASRLTGRSMLRLVGAMAHAQREPHQAIEAGIRCPRCRGDLKEVHNRSRFGAAKQLECVRGHGAWSTFAQWLAERGLLRPMLPADRLALQAVPAGAEAAWCCVNCGAGLSGHHEAACGYCGTQVGVLDIARLAASLDPEGATRAEAVHRTQRERHSFRCHACGHGATGAATPLCPQCGATQISTDLRQVHAHVAHLDEALQRHEEKPAPHVVQQRMAILNGDLDRRRETVRALEDSTRPDGRESPSSSRDEGWLERWLGSLFGEAVPAVVWKVGFAVLLVIWLYWGAWG